MMMTLTQTLIQNHDPSGWLGVSLARLQDIEHANVCLNRPRHLVPFVRLAPLEIVGHLMA